MHETALLIPFLRGFLLGCVIVYGSMFIAYLGIRWLLKRGE